MRIWHMLHCRLLRAGKFVRLIFLKDCNLEIDEAMERIDKGYFITHEDAEKEAESWQAEKERLCEMRGLNNFLKSYNLYSKVFSLKCL